MAVLIVDSKQQIARACGNDKCIRVLLFKQQRLCSRCKLIFYCCRECQLLCWPDHKKNCNVFVSDRTKSEKKIRKKFFHNAFDICARMEVVMNHYKNEEWNDVTDLASDIVRIVKEINGMDKGLLNLSMATSELYRVLSCSCKMTFKIEKAVKFGEMAKNEYERKNISNKILKVSCYMELASCYRIVGRIRDAKQVYNEILSDFNNDNEKYLILIGIGNCNFRLCEYESAIEMFEQARAIAIQNQNEIMEIEVIDKLSRTYFSQRKYEMACDTYNECIDMSGKLAKENECNFHFIFNIIAKSALGIGVCKWADARERNIVAHDIDNSHTTQEYKNEIRECHVLMHESNTWMIEALDIVMDAKTKNIVVSHKLNADIHIRSAYLNFDLENRYNALVHLRIFLDSELENARDACKFCTEKRSNTMEMLTCSGCRVARFCNANCQQQASNKKMMYSGDIVVMHKFVCPLLKKWKRVKIKNTDVSLCNDEHLNFLEKCHTLFFVHKDLCTDQWTK